MALSSDVLYDFVKMTKDDNKSANKESIVYGTAVKSDGSTYVKLDGSDILTPVSATTTVNDGERVTVMIKNHSAIITGNFTSPSARSGDVDDLSKEVAYAKTLIADKVSTAELDAQIARINKLEADTADIGNIKADNVTITGDLTAVKADIQTLKTKDTEVTGELTAVKADISNLETKKLSATDANLKYANIDFSNIGEAAMEYFYANSGLIKNVSIGDATITGELIGVTIKGGLIEGGTVVADKLVLKGDDGLYYKLNTDGVKTETEQTEYNSLNGSIITANSITATKISVDDLVAFDATIAGFEITEKAIYSGVKSTVDNTTRGIYLDKDGQVAFGDSNNFIKFYKDSDGNYKLAITADSILFGASKKSVEETINDTFGGAYYGPRVYEGTIAQSECLDGQGIRVVSTLLPIQNGSGDPYPSGGGRNKLVPNVHYGTRNGIEFTRNTDGSWHVKGTTTDANTFFNLNHVNAITSFLPPGQYIVSGGSADVYIQVMINNAVTNQSSGGQAEFTIPEGVTNSWVRLQVPKAGVTVDETIYPMIRLASDPDSTYAPPSNIRPITGRDALNLNHAGKNLFTGWNFGRINSNNGLFTESETGCRTDYIPVPPSTDIQISGLFYELYSFVAYYDSNKSYISRSEAGRKTTIRFTTPENCRYIAIVQYENPNTSGTVADLDGTAVQVEFGTVVTEYVPHVDLMTYTTSFGQTVYGGRYNWNTGELVSNMRSMNLAGLTVSPVGVTNNGTPYGRVKLTEAIASDAAVICSHYKMVKSGTTYASGMARVASDYIFIYDSRFTDISTATNILAEENPMLVYEVEESIVAYLSPISVVSYEGINTVYTDADGGRIEFGHDSLESLGGASSQELNSVFRVTEQISQKQAETNTVTEKLSTALEVDQKGTHIFSPGYKNQNEVLVDSDSVDILVGGEVYSSYIPKGLMLGDYMLWQPEEIGGLAFNLIKR